jgi:hypothetical protein
MDGLITKEDVRIILSYIPMRKSIFAEERTSILPSQVTKLAGAREGLYENEDGKNIDYKDRLAE